MLTNRKDACVSTSETEVVPIIRPNVKHFFFTPYSATKLRYDVHPRKLPRICSRTPNKKVTSLPPTHVSQTHIRTHNLLLELDSSYNRGRIHDLKRHSTKQQEEPSINHSIRTNRSYNAIEVSSDKRRIMARHWQGLQNVISRLIRKRDPMSLNKYDQGKICMQKQKYEQPLFQNKRLNELLVSARQPQYYTGDYISKSSPGLRVLNNVGRRHIDHVRNEVYIKEVIKRMLKDKGRIKNAMSVLYNN